MSLESALEEERLEMLKQFERPSVSTRVKHATQSLSSNPRSPPLILPATSPTRGRSHLGAPLGGMSSMTLASERRSKSASPPAGQPVRRGAVLNTSPVSNPIQAFISQGYQDTLSSIVSESGSLQSGGTEVLDGAQQAPRSGRASIDPVSERRSGSPTLQQSSVHARSSSPSAKNLPLSPLASPPFNMGILSFAPKKSISQNDLPIDLDNTHRSFSNDALPASEGSLSSERADVASHIHMNSGESVTLDEGVRLDKDLSYDEDSKVAFESSEDSDFSSEEEERGRSSVDLDTLDVAVPNESQRKDSKAPISRTESVPSISHNMLEEASTSTIPRKTMNLLAAAGEEKKVVSSRYQVSSLLPSVTVSPPNSTQANTNKNYIHPNTNYDIHSHASTPFSSDTEENSKDLKRALRMSLNVSPIISTPDTNRLVRTITRGEFASLQVEVEQGRRKQRSYMVASDLSAEAAHALEWTIGTVLRDGDNLLAIYAIDEEAVREPGLVSERKTGEITENITKSVYKGEVVIGDVETTEPSKADSSGPGRGITITPALPSQSISQSSTGANTTAPDLREKDKAERERWAAAESITVLVTKLLRKTRLQVNVVVEVIHCKSPKHLLTEMIDILEPTLVILGSRGRSALKGVLLGSFSNYLVNKSSVPVMVARRKLKQSKYNKTNVRLSNNLAGVEPGTSRGLALAKVD